MNLTSIDIIFFMTDDSQAKRRPIRFPPDSNSVVHINRDINDYEFKEYIVGLPVNESNTGIGIVTLKAHGFIIGETLLVKAGHLAPLRGEVKWLKDLDQDTQRVGVELLE